MKSLAFPLMMCGLFHCGMMTASESQDAKIPPGWCQPVTAERVAALSGPARDAWREYLNRSAQMKDRYLKAVADETQAADIVRLTPAPEAEKTGEVDLRRVSDSWFATEKGRRIVTNVLTYQLPFGGWNKHVDLCSGLRPKGGAYMAGHDSSSWIGTIDNDATHTQIKFLARAWLNDKNAAAAEGARQGLRYLLAAQNPKGGFPQVFPLSGSYHDAVTFNDNAMLGVMKLLQDASHGAPEFAFLSTAERAAAKTAFDRGLACILDSQVKHKGIPTAWCQQHDALTLQPCGARKFEMASLASSESAGIVLFLMQVPEPSDRLVAAVNGAAAWFKKTGIKDMAYLSVKGKDKALVSKPGVMTWPRFSRLEDDAPLFGDRDFSIHTALEEISAERRNGYAWYNSSGQEVLKADSIWKARLAGKEKR